MLSKKLESTLHDALNIASEHAHEFATLEHLLCALIDDDDARAVMRACGLDLDVLKKEVEDYLKRILMTLKIRMRPNQNPQLVFNVSFNERLFTCNLLAERK